MVSVFFSVLLLLVFAATLGAYCLYLKKAQDTLRAVSPQSRRMRPGQVWLMLIPLFNFGYSFIFTKRLALSVSAELKARNAGVGRQKITYDVGLAMSIAQLAFLLRSVNRWMLIGQLGWIVLWLVHWLQLVAAEKRLRTLPTLSNQEGQVFTG